jgi:DNA-directed RNA polymerase subunit RPC12/RpoP
MVATTGKRYKCPKCGAEFIVTRGSEEGELRCGDTPLEQL